jgi:selenoprotein W-related protein
MAASLAAAIKKACGVEAQLVEGAGGIFDVKVDGRLIFSKHETGRFPEDAEILERLASRRV